MVLLLFGAAAPGLAQPARVGGTVVRVRRGDTLPVGLVPVVLHRVGQTSQGPVDTLRTDGRGRFEARFIPDTAALYLLSVRHQGIEYFSAPVRGRPGGEEALVLIVADTSSTAPVEVAERTILIGRPDEGGSRRVIDWLVLANRGEQTRMSPDSARPSFGAPLPADAQNVELADVHLSQFSPDAIGFRRDSVLVFAPISPGRKELVLQYRIPGRLRRFVAPAAMADSVFVLLEEPGAAVERPALRRFAGEQVEGRVFDRWAGVLGGATAIEVRFPAPGLAPGTVLLVLIGVSALGFAALAALTLRCRAARAAPLDPVGVADAIARLDLAASEAGDRWSADERARYAAARARLKTLLTRALAASRRHS